VLIAYLDESYTSERYYIAALIIDENDLPLLDAARARMDAYISGYGIAAGTELHAHAVMTGRDGWAPVAQQVRARLAIYQQWMNEIAALPAVMVVRGVDIPRLRARYRYPNAPHQVVLQHTLEVLNRYAKQQGTQIRVVADQVPGQSGYGADLLRYQEDGTPGYKSSRLDAVVPPLTFESSAGVTGLQAADGIAYIYRRLDAHAESNPRVAAAVQRLWSTLQPIWYEVWRWDP